VKRTLTRIALFLFAAASGWGASELLRRSDQGTELIARFVRSEAALRLETNLRAASSGEPVRAEEIEREMDLLRWQFGDEARFQQALERSDLSLGKWRDELAAHLRARAWIEKQIAPQLRATEEELREYYARHRGQFAQPQRYRASHLFVAAPNDSPPDVVGAKLKEIEALSMRIIAGEKFAQLAAEASEDEATKHRGGDLGYFSESHMPPEFIEELKKLGVGQTSGPLRSHLGFHLVQLTEVKPATELTPAQARVEMTNVIANQKRAVAVAILTERLGTPEFTPR
jgi:hypothetical protein